MNTPALRFATVMVLGSVLLPAGMEAQANPRSVWLANTTAPTCPYLKQTNEKESGETTATFNPSTKVLNIQVNRSVPGMFWSIAERRTRASADKILTNCPEIKMVKVDFKSGQKLIHPPNMSEPQ